MWSYYYRKFSADFMQAFGNDKNITPFLDQLAKESLLFTNCYASGNRTVRGLEAVTFMFASNCRRNV
jgi:phosphoglycerol transferase MdoB-like AlkP superfamily enzyme